MIEGAAEWAVFMDAGEFGEPVTWTAAGGAVFELSGIFTAAHSEISRHVGAGVSGTIPVLTLPPVSVLPVVPMAGDFAQVRGRLWRVADIQQDGSGLTRAILERAD